LPEGGVFNQGLPGGTGLATTARQSDQDSASNEKMCSFIHGKPRENVQPQE
jgi:hypothetical protein